MDFEKVIFDLGSGDFRFSYKMAKKNPQNLYIAVEPMPTQSKKYTKRISREKLGNFEVLAVSVENLAKLHSELKGKANEIHINFPWGSLLAGVMGKNEEILKNVAFIAGEGCAVFITTGYSENTEPNEVERLNLDEISENTLNEQIAPVFEKFGFKLVSFENVENSEVSKIESSWGKKLKFGQKRKFYSFSYIKV